MILGGFDADHNKPDSFGGMFCIYSGNDHQAGFGSTSIGLQSHQLQVA
jgi:hypothetical protein